MSKKILLAVLGRGSQMEYPGGPWVLTKDFEVWDLKAGRSSTLTTPNDEDGNCVIGGGELNLAAGIALYKKLDPELIVFAYGENAPHVGGRDRPSESSVTSKMFRKAIAEAGMEARVDVFDPDFWQTQGKGSGTFQEVKNIFKLAVLGKFDEVVLVTILVHMNRVLGMAAKHLQDPEFAGLAEKVRPEITEFVLLHEDPGKYAERVWKIFGSEAMVRNLQRETNALKALRIGITQSTQGLIQDK